MPTIECVEIGRHTLFCGDCLEVMQALDPDDIDAVVTDPPYGIEYAEWDGDIPPWLEPARALSSLVIFTTGPETQWSYPRPTWVCNWYRPASSSRNLLGGGFNHWTPILVYGDCKCPVDTINLHAIANSYPPGFIHPSPKPVALMLWLVAMCGQTILDPFMGSGTTGVACERLGRKFIGVEIERRYFDIACKRIEAEVAQGKFEFAAQ